jgi:glycosyltransferase involved in cell wall biosynthesis
MFEVSVVIPLYRSAASLPALVERLNALKIEGGHEVILVNDGSPDDTAAVCRELLPHCRFPVVFVDLMRNFGEHNAVLAGYREARGKWVVNIDDDLQNAPEDIPMLVEYARAERVDVVYSSYPVKQHEAWRNVGSRFANTVANLVLEKPRDLYLSSFRCVSAPVAKAAAKYTGPFPYIDGLITQTTQSFGVRTVQHQPRHSGQSNYNLRRLARLWLNLLLGFSILPLRIAIGLGLFMAVAGFGFLIVVVAEHFLRGTPLGWGSLMGGLILFCGTQLVIIGGVGEYVGRIFLSINEKPQSVVRSVQYFAPLP